MGWNLGLIEAVADCADESKALGKAGCEADVGCCFGVAQVVRQS